MGTTRCVNPERVPPPTPLGQIHTEEEVASRRDTHTCIPITMTVRALPLAAEDEMFARHTSAGSGGEVGFPSCNNSCGENHFRSRFDSRCDCRPNQLLNKSCFWIFRDLIALERACARRRVRRTRRPEGLPTATGGPWAAAMGSSSGRPARCN